jgi:hypothetical protein
MFDGAVGRGAAFDVLLLDRVLLPERVLLPLVPFPEGWGAGVRGMVVVKRKVLMPVLVCLLAPRPTMVESEVDVTTVWFGWEAFWSGVSLGGWRRAGSAYLGEGEEREEEEGKKGHGGSGQGWAEHQWSSHWARAMSCPSCTTSARPPPSPPSHPISSPRPSFSATTFSPSPHTFRSTISHGHLTVPTTFFLSSNP